MTNGFSIICASLFFFALGLLPGVVQAQKFVLAYSSISALKAPFWIMKDTGFVKQEGLDMELVYIPIPRTVAQATLAGDIVLSPANGQVIVDAGLNGGDLVAIGALRTWWRFMSWPRRKSSPSTI